MLAFQSALGSVSIFSTKMKKASRGFTMVELLMVIATIGVMSIVAIPKFLDYRQEAKVATASQAAMNLSRAVVGKRITMLNKCGIGVEEWESDIVSKLAEINANDARAAGRCTDAELGELSYRLMDSAGLSLFDYMELGHTTVVACLCAEESNPDCFDMSYNYCLWGDEIRIAPNADAVLVAMRTGGGSGGSGDSGSESGDSEGETSGEESGSGSGEAGDSGDTSCSTSYAMDEGLNLCQEQCTGEYVALELCGGGDESSGDTGDSGDSGDSGGANLTASCSWMDSHYSITGQCDSESGTPVAIDAGMGNGGGASGDCIGGTYTINAGASDISGNVNQYSSSLGSYLNQSFSCSGGGGSSGDSGDSGISCSIPFYDVGGVCCYQWQFNDGMGNCGEPPSCSCELDPNSQTYCANGTGGEFGGTNVADWQNANCMGDSGDSGESGEIELSGSVSLVGCECAGSPMSRCTYSYSAAGPAMVTVTHSWGGFTDEGSYSRSGTFEITGVPPSSVDLYVNGTQFNSASFNDACSGGDSGSDSGDTGDSGSSDDSGGVAGCVSSGGGYYWEADFFGTPCYSDSSCTQVQWTNGDTYSYTGGCGGCTRQVYSAACLGMDNNVNESVDVSNCGCVQGCTDSNATNYNPSAGLDDGSCTYGDGDSGGSGGCSNSLTASCQQVAPGVWDVTGNCDCNSSLQITYPGFGSTSVSCNNGTYTYTGSSPGEGSVNYGAENVGFTCSE